MMKKMKPKEIMLEVDLMLLELKKKMIYTLKYLKKAQQQAPKEEKEEKKEKPTPEDKWKSGGKKLGTSNVEVVGEEKQEFTEIKKDIKEMSEEEQMMEIIKQMNQQRPNQPKIEKEKTAVLTLYKNGFCINEGEFLSFEDPNNKKMMEEIQQGSCPKAIRDMIGPAMSYAFQLDPRDTNYVAPKPSFKAFSGTGGKTLGSTKQQEEKKEEKMEIVEKVEKN